MERSPAPGRITAMAPTAPGSEMSPLPRLPRYSVATLLAVATICVEIAQPLLAGTVLRAATVASVILFAAASLAHAAAVTDVAAAFRLLLVAGGIGLAAEAVGVATGVPFGEYSYTDSLGPRLLGVPLLVPLAWTMMAYPCLLLGRRLGHRRSTSVALGAAALASWDIFLDPQMVAAGHWTWTHPTPALAGVPGVPLTNYAGWLLVATVMMAALDRALAPDRDLADRGGRNDIAPALLLGWTWIGSVVGNLAFFGRPAVAGYGAVAMGATVLPYLLDLRTGQVLP